MYTLSHWTPATLLEQPRLLLLAALLLVAALIDVYRWRIPNALTFGGALSAFFIGLIEPGSAGQALMTWAAGLALGFGVMLPLYLLRALGAGDVKLMAMAGAFLGAPHAAGAALMVFVTGGVLALLWVLQRRAWAALLTGLAPWRAGAVSLGRMPYGASICIGTLLYVVAFEPQGLQWSRWFVA